MTEEPEQGHERIEHAQGATRPVRVQAGPFLLALPLFVACLVIVHMVSRGDAGRQSSVELDTDDIDAVEGFTGRTSLRGVELDLRLTRLHGERGHQLYDADALRERLDLGSGEPWRLEIRRASDDRANTPVLRVTVRELVAVGEIGGRLLPIEPAEEPGPLSDPLRSVLVPGSVELRPGDTGQVVLWGSLAEGEVVRIEGMDDAEPASMKPSEIPRRELPRHLAQHGRPDPSIAPRVR